MIRRIVSKLDLIFGVKVNNLKVLHLKHYSTTPQENKIAVNGVQINYVKVGTGPKPLLCMPGSLGTIWSDFKPQVENLNREKFTVVAWDPPGYGKSRPPERDFSGAFLHRDADCAFKLMKALGFNKFSLLGWSDGGITAMILTGKYPEHVEKLVIWGSNAYITEEEVKIMETMRDTNKWSDRMKAPLIKMYGEQGLREMWNSAVDTYIYYYKHSDGNVCKEYLSNITCPTFLLHGKKDPMLAPEHPGYLAKNIKNCRVHVFEEGKHNIHLRYAEEFNKMVEDFLTE